MYEYEFIKLIATKVRIQKVKTLQASDTSLQSEKYENQVAIELSL